MEFLIVLFCLGILVVWWYRDHLWPAMDRARDRRENEKYDATASKRHIIGEKYGYGWAKSISQAGQYMLLVDHLDELTLEEVALIVDQLDEFSLERFLELKDAAIAERQKAR
jgi:hypothetical protein